MRMLANPPPLISVDRQHKARVFQSALNLDAGEADTLKEALLRAARTRLAVPVKRNEYGQKYLIESEMNHSGKSANIRSAWIVRDDEDFPRLITCYVL